MFKQDSELWNRSTLIDCRSTRPVAAYLNRDGKKLKFTPIPQLF